MSDTTAEHEATIEQLMRAVYLGLRGDQIDPEQVVALACELMDCGHGTDAVLEIVERPPADVSPAEMTALAWRILDDSGFEPGFDLAPERLELLRAALRSVARDLPTWIDGDPEIEISKDWFPVGACVRLADGERLDWGGPIPPNACQHPVTALTSLANLIQESLLERTRRVWPECLRHNLGVHGLARDGAAVWWCAGGSGHVLAPVGQLRRALGPPLRPAKGSPA
ncbi:hypothetical protein [Phaeacidiphilus oryzae]|uniref:hypothetical protein n=1 Tax=Phaeacidiphilus oryzae TaxID=348818 RepID=UPI00055D340F|nr:hypothetical protein [Phaeacidiphilus oryzae]